MHGLSLPVRLASCEYNITIRMLATWHNYSHPLYRFSRIIPNASSCLLFSKLCLHNRRIPSALQLSLTHSVHVLCKLISEDWTSHPHMNMIYIVVCKYGLFVHGHYSHIHVHVSGVINYHPHRYCSDSISHSPHNHGVRYRTVYLF